ncbi:hypothetical protein NFI96_024070, partial [Prochilodus magdalenae]
MKMKRGWESFSMNNDPKHTARATKEWLLWFGAATVQDRNRLQRTIKTAAKITGAPLPTIQD